MKKTYESPSIEKVAFKYRDQVVVASTPTSGACTQHYIGSEQIGCQATHWSGNNENLNT